jgi:hypothetical protein
VCFCLIAVDQHDGHIDYNQICQAYGSRNACLLVVVVVVAAEVVVAAAEVVVVVAVVDVAAAPAECTPTLDSLQNPGECFFHRLRPPIEKMENRIENLTLTRCIFHWVLGSLAPLNLVTYIYP